MTHCEIVHVDYRLPRHADDLRRLLQEYATDPMGGGQGLDAATLETLPARLASFPTAFSLLAYLDEQPVGLANCFFGFSTFAARRLVNIHDVIVRQQYRGFGVCRRLFTAIESIAREHDCCKLTLEVLEGNVTAIATYERLGYAAYALDPSHGRAMFWHKSI